MAPKDMSVSWALALVDVTLLGKKRVFADMVKDLEMGAYSGLFWWA